VIFVLQNAPQSDLKLGEAKLLPFRADSGAAKFDLTLTLTESDSGIEGSLRYNSELFEAATITRMIDYYQILLNGIVSAPEKSIDTLPLLAEAAKQKLLEEWNQIEADELDTVEQ
jgi:non-ribosomal peptide synthetase component F